MRLQTQNPAVYSLFQGDQWTTRLEIGFTALFAAVAAGLLVLLIALTLIILKLGFLLLLVAGPFFLIVGVHPGFGRVVAIRWFEMLVGVLLKQVAVALVLSVLLYCYSLIMSTSDQQLPWALKIMMISLVTVAVFIYRKPFQHLFSSVGYGMLGANERAETSWREGTFGFRRVAATATGTVLPGVGAARASRWARRTASDGGGGADGTGTGVAEGGVRATSSDGMSGVPTADSHSATRQWPEAGVGTGRTAPPLPLPANGAAPNPNGGSAGWARGGGGAGAGSRGPGQPPVRTTGPMPAAPTPAARPAPPAPRPSGTPRRTATRTASTPPAPTQSTPTPAPPFWSRSRRRPQ
jgi:TrbL/VirB6 plasmid conjugal transfer protein